MKKLILSSLATAAIAALTGCSVSPMQVNEKAESATNAIREAQAAEPAHYAPKPGLRKMKGNFLGANAIPVQHSAGLPPAMRNVVLSFGHGKGGLRSVAGNIQTATGIPVRIAGDVPSEEGDYVEVEVAPMPGGNGGPLPVAQGTQTKAGVLPLSFKGDLTEYLDLIASKLNISWQYDKGEILFHRMVSKTFSLDISPGIMTYRDDVSAGGSGTANSESGTGGNFSSTSSAGVDAQLNPWVGVEEGIKSMLTKEGKVYINQATGTVVVTDIRDVVDRVENFVKSENAMLGRQVRIDVREILVEDTGGSSAGFDASLIYTSLLNRALNTDGLSVVSQPNYSVSTGAPSSLVGSGSGSFTFNYERENSKWTGSQVVAQALNEVGKIVSDTTRAVVTTNRVPGRVQDVVDQAYLKETKPSSSSSSDGTGVPGLVPGIVTYGDHLMAVPTITSSDRVLIQLFFTRSDLKSMDSQSTGEGATYQQINTPVLALKKYAESFRVRNGDTIVIVSNTGEGWSTSNRGGLTGASITNQRKKVLSVMLVTPRVMGS